ALSNKLSADTIYTLKLHRRGSDIIHGRFANGLELLTGAGATQPIPASLPPAAPRPAADGRDAPPLAARGGAYRGTGTASETHEAARGDTLDTAAKEQS